MPVPYSAEDFDRVFDATVIRRAQSVIALGFVKDDVTLEGDTITGTSRNGRYQTDHQDHPGEKGQPRFLRRARMHLRRARMPASGRDRLGGAGEIPQLRKPEPKA